MLHKLVEVERKTEPQSEHLAEALISCARAARTVHKYAEAENCLREAMEIFRLLPVADKIQEVNIELYWLHNDTGNGVKAALCQRAGIIGAGRDVANESASTILGVHFNAWPAILTSLDSVSTAQNLAEVCRQADKVARQQLTDELEAERAARKKAEQEAAEKAARDKEAAQKGGAGGGEGSKADPPPSPKRSSVDQAEHQGPQEPHQ